MKLTRFIFPLLLVFALLFTQQGGMAHGVSHALAEQSQDQSLPHDKLCDLCAVYAQMGSGLLGAPTLVTFSETISFFALTSSSPFLSHFFSAFAARAPPDFV